MDLANDKLMLNIELKSLEAPTASIGIDVVARVRAHGMADDVVISSFNPLALRRAKKAGKEIECALLAAPDLPKWMTSRATLWYSRRGRHTPGVSDGG